jgi:hypothetical protein
MGLRHQMGASCGAGVSPACGRRLEARTTTRGNRLHWQNPILCRRPAIDRALKKMGAINGAPTKGKKALDEEMRGGKGKKGLTTLFACE